MVKGKKGKAIPVTSRGGPQGCQRSWLTHFLDNRLTDGGEVVSLTCRPPFTPRKSRMVGSFMNVEQLVE
jgi:hypothetical protein